MSRFPRSCGAAPRGFSTVFATVLALLLSALGGIRLGLDRLAGEGEDDVPAIACLATFRGHPVADDRATPPRAVVVDATPVVAAPAVTTPRWALLTADAPIPGSRLGSAGGPRAPC